MHTWHRKSESFSSQVLKYQRVPTGACQITNINRTKIASVQKDNRK